MNRRKPQHHPFFDVSSGLGLGPVIGSTIAGVLVCLVAVASWWLSRYRVWSTRWCSWLRW